MGVTNYMVPNSQPAVGGQADMGLPPVSTNPYQPPPQNTGVMGLSPQVLHGIMQSGVFGANPMSQGYGAAGNGLTQYAPYSQGIGPQDAATIQAMFAGAPSSG